MACLNNFCVSMSVIIGAFDFPFCSFCFGGGFGVSFGGRESVCVSWNLNHSWQGVGMCVLELEPLMVKAFAAVKGLVGTFCFDSKTEFFSGGAI